MRNMQVGVDLKKATLSLTNLPAHTSIDLVFLLATVDSWDGEGSGAGPDRFNVSIDGVTLFSEVFENSNSGTQSYSPPVGVELARREDFGFTGGTGFFGDSAYRMGLDPIFDNIAHSSDSFTTEWFTDDTTTRQGFADESWAIDNVSISVSAIPEPNSMVILGAVWGLAGLRRQRRAGVQVATKK